MSHDGLLKAVSELGDISERNLGPLCAFLWLSSVKDHREKFLFSSFTVIIPHGFFAPSLVRYGSLTAPGRGSSGEVNPWSWRTGTRSGGLTGRVPPPSGCRVRNEETLRTVSASELCVMSRYAQKYALVAGQFESSSVLNALLSRAGPSREGPWALEPPAALQCVEAH